MTDPLASTDYGTVRTALAGGAIALEDVDRRFPDLKEAFFGDAFGDARDPIEAVLAYKSRGSGSYDCDGSTFWVWNRGRPYCTTARGPEAVARLYEALWGYRVEELGSREGHVQFLLIPPYFPYDAYPDVTVAKARRVACELSGGDVMNSFWTTYKQALSREVVQGDIPAILDDGEAFHGSVDGEVMAQLRIFARLSHTLGNLIPCQKGFNAGRYWSTMDYWDLTLIFVRDWYLTKQQHQAPEDAAVPDTPLNAGVLAACSRWLNSFGRAEEGWRAFVRQNFLQPYVDDDYEVRPFFAGHGFGYLRPEGRQDVLACLMSMNACIIARGNLMLEELARGAGAGARLPHD